jgi:hypothetical protein
MYTEMMHAFVYGIVFAVCLLMVLGTGLFYLWKFGPYKTTIWVIGMIAIVSIFLSGCGSWTDWSKEQEARIPILGEPVDEAAVRDAVATVLGDSDMHPFSVWFSNRPVVNPLTHELVAGTSIMCTCNEQIRVYVPPGTRCLLHTSLVHELMHRYDRYVLGRSCKAVATDPHPLRLFGKCVNGCCPNRDGPAGGLTGKINEMLRNKHCPGVSAQPSRNCGDTQ